MPTKSLPSRPSLDRGSAPYHEGLAIDFVVAYDSGDAGAIQRLNEHYQRSYTWDDVRAEVWHSVYKVRQAKGRPGSLSLDDARELIARYAGFGNWQAFLDAGGNPPPGDPYALDGKCIEPRRNLSSREWDQLIAVMKEQGITALGAGGQMTDAALERVSQLDHVTRLELGSSQQLTDDGLLHLARMPQLRHLDLSNYPGSPITDRGLEVLRHLPELRTFQICWQPGITDVGVANLRFCEQIECVDLLGTLTGDGAIQALTGKRHLRRLKTGRSVTDAGLPLLHQFPAFKAWSDDRPNDSSASSESGPNQLLLDGPFTDAGLAGITGLNGLFELSFFWHVSALTAQGLRVLADLANLSFLGCEGKLCNDEAMRHIAAIPRLRRLMAQGTVASDDGFEALSRSRTLERIWGRDCANLTGRGFLALSRMPSLRSLSVSCKNVDDQSLAALPRFPALKQLTPMDVTDAGFRHIGACRGLEGLTCMYCRETTDAATEQLLGLTQLKSYYAGLTRITDRSLELLGRLPSLEEIEFYECKGLTDAGLAFLARLPRLREVTLSGLPHVTLEGTKVFPATVRVKHSV
ncbi:MAG TPA: hypothetical protein VNU68_27605 [Verrucomicrobiae bacterium]|nr:hypothetical protein [Verrucomicrobiae bacterium]